MATLSNLKSVVLVLGLGLTAMTSGASKPTLWRASLTSPVETGALNATSTSVPPLKSVPSLGPGFQKKMHETIRSARLRPMKYQRFPMKSYWRPDLMNSMVFSQPR